MTEPTTPDPDGLTPRQASLVDAVCTRVWSGVPMNQYDYLAIVDMAAVLEMPIRSGRRAPENDTT